MIRLILCFLLLSQVAWAEEKIVGHPEPLPEETLSPVIRLTGQCSDVNVVEWVGPQTTQAIQIIDSTCNLVANNFYQFVAEEGYAAIQVVKPSYRISLLLWDEFSGYRGLNDNTYRFVERPRFCSIEAKVCHDNEEPLQLVGWSDKQLRIIFVRNDVTDLFGINPKFTAILAHELFHSLSFDSGSYNQHQNIAIEEILARKFTEKLGFEDI
jgi:hypothetical protein